MMTKPDRRQSVRRRLLQLLAAPIAAVLVIGTAAQIFSSAEPVRQAYDRDIADAALALSLNVRVRNSGRIDARVSQETLNVLLTDSADKVFFQIRAPDGSVVAGNQDLPSANVASGNPAFLSAFYRDRPIRLVTYRRVSRAGPVMITVAETLNKRAMVRSRIWSTAFWTSAAELIAVLACVWLAVRAALKPVGEIGEQIARRSPEDLAPLPTSAVPLELRSVVEKLNSLLAEIETSTRAQRDFLDSAAHQLRTPLAGMLAQLDLLAGDEQDAARRARLDSIRAAALRLSHTAQQLLALARSGELGHRFSPRESVDLVALAQSVVSGQVQRAAAAGIDLGAELHSAQVVGVSWLLTEALGNLIDNALIYTPAGGMVTVRTGMQDDHAFVEVVDSGVGIPPAEREKVLSRFYRGSLSRGSGSGLGLSIVAEVARQHDAALGIGAGEQGRGTRVRIDFPR